MKPVAIVTPASTVIGRAIALDLSEAGQVLNVRRAFHLRSL